MNYNQMAKGNQKRVEKSQGRPVITPIGGNPTIGVDLKQLDAFLEPSAFGIEILVLSLNPTTGKHLPCGIRLAVQWCRRLGDTLDDIVRAAFVKPIGQHSGESLKLTHPVCRAAGRCEHHRFVCPRDALRQMLNIETQLSFQGLACGHLVNRTDHLPFPQLNQCMFCAMK